MCFDFEWKYGNAFARIAADIRVGSTINDPHFFGLSHLASCGWLKLSDSESASKEFYLESGFEPVIELCHGQDQGGLGA